MKCLFTRAAQIAFCLAIVLSPRLEAQRDSGAIRRYLDGALEAQKLEGYRGTVERVEAQADGKAVIFFKAEKMHPDKDGETIGPAKQFQRNWPHADRPAPFAPGQQVWLGVNQEGKPVQVIFDAVLSQLRFRDDGEVELAMRPTTNKTLLLLLHPQRVGVLMDDTAVDVIWDLHYGLVVTVLVAGPEEVEKEGLNKRTPGIPFANDRKRKLTPGRDGWRRPVEGDRQRIPDRQYTQAAG